MCFPATVPMWHGTVPLEPIIWDISCAAYHTYHTNEAPCLIKFHGVAVPECVPPHYLKKGALQHLPVMRHACPARCCLVLEISSTDMGLYHREGSPYHPVWTFVLNQRTICRDRVDAQRFRRIGPLFHY